MPISPLSYRMMNHDDVGSVPIGCQGSAGEVHARINDLGSCGVLGFNDGRHVAQLQFRRYDRFTRSPNSIWDAAYWGDFGSFAPALPDDSLAVHCLHIGQLEEGIARDPIYQGRGIGGELMAFFLKWATAEGFRACVAKAAPPVRPVQNFMGGQSGGFFERHGFHKIAEWNDEDLARAVAERKLLPPDTPASLGSLVSCWVLRLDQQPPAGN